MASIEAKTRAHGSDRMPNSGVGEFESEQDRAKWQQDLDYGIYRQALASSEEHRVHSKSLIEAIESKRIPLGVSLESMTPEERETMLRGESSSSSESVVDSARSAGDAMGASGAVAPDASVASAVAGLETKRKDYEYAVKRLQGLVRDVGVAPDSSSNDGSDKEQQLRRVVGRLLDGLPGEAANAE